MLRRPLCRLLPTRPVALHRPCLRFKSKKSRVEPLSDRLVALELGYDTDDEFEGVSRTRTRSEVTARRRKLKSLRLARRPTKSLDENAEPAEHDMTNRSAPAPRESEGEGDPIYGDDAEAAAKARQAREEAEARQASKIKKKVSKPHNKPFRILEVFTPIDVTSKASSTPKKTDSNAATPGNIALLDEDGTKLGQMHEYEAVKIAVKKKLKISVLQVNGKRKLCQLHPPEKRIARVDTYNVVGGKLKRKEVEFNTRIQENDIKTKVNQIARMLKKMCVVSITVVKKAPRNAVPLENEPNVRTLNRMLIPKIQEYGSYRGTFEISPNRIQTTFIPKLDASSSKT